MPYCSCSFSCQPAPTPRRSRPPLSWSTVAAQFASTAGWRYVLPSTRVPRRSTVGGHGEGGEGRGALEGRRLHRTGRAHVAHEVVHDVHAVPPGGLGVPGDLEDVVPRLGQRRPDGEPHAASRLDDEVDAPGEGGDVVGLDGGEQGDPELVAAQLAVALGVDDPVVAEHRRHHVGVGHRGVEVDRGDHVAALRRLGHERGGVARGLGPAVDRLGGPVAAGGRPLEAAVLVDPVDLLVGEEDRGQGGGVVGLVLAAVLEGDAEVERRRDPAVGRRDPLDALDGRRRRGRQPEAAVGRQALLRREVVDVDLAAGRSAARRRPTWRRRAPARRRPPGARAASPRRWRSRCG